MDGTLRRAFTLVEILLILVLVGVICGIAVPWGLRRVDRAHVRGARAEIVAGLAAARAAAIATGQHVAVHFDSATASMVVRAGPDTIVHRNVGAVHGVSVRSNRDSMAYTPSGLGYGASNQTIVLRRGGAADSVIVSRLGRVR